MSDDTHDDTRGDVHHGIGTPDIAPPGEARLNPFVVVDNASAFIDFLTQVLGGTEHEAARTPTPDGLLIHAEVRFGDVVLMMSDRLDGWPLRPGLLQLWVLDIAETLRAAAAAGAEIVTEATPFYGQTTLGRMLDPWGNLWWLYERSPGQPDPTPSWEGGSDVVFSTIDRAMRRLAGGA